MPRSEWNVPECLQEIRFEDPETFVEIVELYLVDAEERLSDLMPLLQSSDRQSEAKAALHSLKGSSQQIGADEMGALLEGMERMAQERGCNTVLPQSVLLVDAFRRVESQMRALLNTAATGSSGPK